VCIARAAGLEHGNGYIVLALAGVIDFARSTSGA
jgi:hypothetical protein